MKFRAGQKVKIIKKGNSFLSNRYFGRITFITRTYEGWNYCSVAIGDGGVYFDEIEIVGEKNPNNPNIIISNEI